MDEECGWGVSAPRSVLAEPGARGAVVKVKPERTADCVVVGVRYDKLQGTRFRHGTKLLRFRPDKDPRACTWAELRPPRDLNGPTITALLRGRPA